MKYSNCLTWPLPKIRVILDNKYYKHIDTGHHINISMTYISEGYWCPCIEINMQWCSVSHYKAKDSICNTCFCAILCVIYQ